MTMLEFVDSLVDLSPEADASKINEVFQKVLTEIESFLDLTPLYRIIEISFSETIQPEINNENIFSLGVNRHVKSDHLSIEVYKKYNKYLPIILLREIYNCFIPDTLLEKRNVQFIIHQLLTNEFSKFSLIEEWNSLIYHQIVDYELMDALLDKLEKYLKLEGAISFTIGFLRRNATIIENMGDLFYTILFKEYALETAEFMNDDDLIETIRITCQMFYRLKSYKSLLEYENYFKEFKNKHIIKTDLSLNKYIDKMRKVKNYTYISPSLQFNWMSINVIFIHTFFIFNPILKRASIEKIIQNIPFLIVIKRSRNNFSSELSAMFYIPKIYVKDFLSLLEKLEKNGYILEKKCLMTRSFTNLLNLNYFREFHKSKRKFIDRDNSNYKKKYEIEFNIEYIPTSFKPNLSILDFAILDRLNSFSGAGFTFERRIETLNALKSDINNRILSEKAILNNLNKYFHKIDSSLEFKNALLYFLKKFQIYGFFYVKNLLNDLLICLDKINNILTSNSEIKNEYQLQEFINITGFSQELEYNLLYNVKKINHMLFNKFITLYFKSKKEFYKEHEKFQFFNNFFKLCNSLKVFNIAQIIRIIENREIRQEIYLTRKEKLKDSYTVFDPEKLTNQDIETILDKFVKQDPPLAKPLLINSILTSTFSNYFPAFFLKDRSETRRNLRKLIKFFPRTWLFSLEDLFTGDKLIFVILYLPNLKEKDLFLSILHSLFGENLINFKRLYWSGLIGMIGPLQYPFLDFYDFRSNQFFYSKDLYKQYFLYVQKILGNPLEIRQEFSDKIHNFLWFTEKNLKDLSKKVETRFIKENAEYNKKLLNEIFQFHDDLTLNILNNKRTGTSLIKNYIKSIKFIPCFEQFGLSQYFLFIRPFNLGDTDLKLLLSNTFQKVKYPVRIDSSSSLFINYLYPYRNPNKAYLNYHTKTKKNVREYCLFFLKKVFQIFNFNYNLGKNKWNYDPNRFKIHIQNILFNPTYKSQVSKVKHFNLGDLKSSEFFGQNSMYFEKLVQIYNWRASDLYSYNFENNVVPDLLKESLIFPYIKLKNLGLLEKIYIILPNIKKELNKKILQIFSFFNFGFVYEIEGEYFIYGMNDEISFENGVMIKLYFPDCEINEFESIFELLFHYLGIDHYLILNDMIDGKKLLEFLYQDLSFLKSYNPLKNLKWSKKEKRWMNYKLYGEGLKPIYHPLLPKEEHD
ncbi:MAG: hypothetical protein ACFFA6_00535 [Promethearchaeota archaeon]